MKVYSIKDNIAGRFGSLTLQENDALAIRDLKVAINQNKNNVSMLCLRPEDFSLYSMGSYDDTTGTIVPKVDFVVNCIDLKDDVSHGRS